MGREADEAGKIPDHQKESWIRPIDLEGSVQETISRLYSNMERVQSSIVIQERS